MTVSPRLATFALYCAGLFVALLLLLHFVRADLQPSWHMVSEYSVGTGGWLMQLAFFALASSFFSLALALRSHAKGFLGVAGRFFLAIAGVGLAMGGLFNTDPPGTAREHLSSTGMLHGFAFMLGVPGVVFAVAFITSSLWRSPEWRSQRVALLLSASLVGLTLLVFGIAMSRAVASQATGPDFAVGWQNRALVLAWALWLAVVARRTQREPPDHTSTPKQPKERQATA